MKLLCEKKKNVNCNLMELNLWKRFMSIVKRFLRHRFSAMFVLLQKNVAFKTSMINSSTREIEKILQMGVWIISLVYSSSDTVICISTNFNQYNYGQLILAMLLKMNHLPHGQKKWNIIFDNCLLLLNDHFTTS